MSGKSCWYVVDGYRPSVEPGGIKDLIGHEWYGVLNCNTEDAHILIDIYYEDQDPVLNIPLIVPAQRLRSFYSHDLEKLGGVKLSVNEQYSLRVRSDIGVVLQYGRLDINQPNLAYLATMGYSE